MNQQERENVGESKTEIGLSECEASDAYSPSPAAQIIKKKVRFRQRVNPIVFPYPSASLNEGKDCNFVQSERANG